MKGIEMFVMTEDNKPTALAIAKSAGAEPANVWMNEPQGQGLSAHRND